ncbi:MAG TPA: DHA2 family efflux MFS transporter permease subunit [Pseudonocardiaceae bacterium]
MSIAMVIVLGAIMSILDITVVNVAIPKLAADFQTPLTTIQWVVTGYTLALASVIPLTAWGADRFGAKRLYLVSIVLFVLGSALAGIAWNVESLIAFRVLQGLGGGMLMPVGMTILTRAAGPNRLGRIMAVIGIPMLLGPVLGPILGGWLVDDFSWRWIFFINLPVGLLALVLGIRILEPDPARSERRLDWVGMLLLPPGLAALIYGLAESGAKGGFGHAEVLAPGIGGALLLVAFGWHALRTDEPLVDLRLFRNKVFSASALSLALVVIAMFGGMLLLPLYLQLVRGETALDTGLLMAPNGLGAMLAIPIAGRLADRTGVGRFVPFGLVAVAASFLWLTGLEAGTSYWQFSVVLFVMGVGMGFTMMPVMTGALQTLRRADIANASTTINITQQVGASIGTATLSVILANELANRLGDGGGGDGGGGIGALAQLPPEQFAQIQPLLADAFGSTFVWAVGFVVAAIAVVAILLPKRKPAPVTEDGEPSDTPAPVVLH